MPDTISKKPPLILTIDDEEFIRNSFTDILEDSGYEVIQAENGHIGLKKIREHKPDLILCDLQMPEMNGLEVVRTVKEEFEKIPILIVSGAGVLDDAIEAVRLGAWDYLVKPLFNLDVLLQAVEKALDRAKLIAENEAYQKSLEKQTVKLQQEIEERKRTEKQLVQSEKMAALGDLVAGVAHEINTPLGIGVTGISYLNDSTKAFKKLFAAGEATKTDLKAFMEDCEEACQLTLSNLNRAAKLVAGFKRIAVDQSSDERRIFNIKQYIDEILFSLYPRIKKTKHTINVDAPEDLEMNSYPGAFSQVLTNLVMNSLLHGFENIEKGQITITVKNDDHLIILRYEDNGKGMTQEQQKKIFDPFFTTKRGSGGTGLGMHLVFNLVSKKLNGEILCTSTVDKGTFFTITVPMGDVKK
ncbi:hybrid sensor histidine kinase/response regulator [Desulfobacter hydrogenophilus]|uniref:histidine kinase n=1 Tax=Desulfobacter hydrogenophilus TaxID=2291 RepID=A0A328FDX8_9BACT|nr:response regulator [Desulfobacter hydrogenophilus]NDY72578.1 hybrid sensor histidine kinase/response regulator [Desulfobacter hydrogenophilus]QBH13300.1 hybrid sensor histidine kinase/response regulator [Desulfobacter hydrogenophilus]RAM01303.1 hybrid sensor histidine kinase/response regulator [Desulfobacter hydrogenophilus]